MCPVDANCKPRSCVLSVDVVEVDYNFWLKCWTWQVTLEGPVIDLDNNVVAVRLRVYSLNL